MSDTELVNMGVVEAAEKIRGKEISPVELVNALLRRIASIDSMINSYLMVTADLALKLARKVEKELMRGEQQNGLPLGRLHGVPIALKDLIETSGIRTSAGSLFFADHVPLEDAYVVRRLQAAGAILLGKQNMHEIALGLTSVNPHFGPVRNPWDINRIAGGSSGGTAAALAARLCPGALGTDTGGSIRVPSSLCGTVGLKPTYGRVSTQGVIPLSWNLDHVGPMARKVEDAALLLQVIAGYDSGDPASVNVETEDYSAQIKDGIRGFKFALVDDPYFQSEDEEIKNLLASAAKVFSELGAHVELAAFPGGQQAAMANGMMTQADGAVYHSERLANQPGRFGSDVLQRLNTGASYKLEQYIRARRDQVVLRRQFEIFFEKFDFLITPTTIITAPEIAGQLAVMLAQLLTHNTAPFNLTGLPAISLPCGFTSQGMPVGMQLVTRSWGEAALLKAAYAYDQATGWTERSPKLL